MGKYNCTAGLWVDRFEYLQQEHLKLDAFFLDWWNPIQSNWKPAVGILVPTHLKGKVPKWGPRHAKDKLKQDWLNLVSGKLKTNKWNIWTVAVAQLAERYLRPEVQINSLAKFYNELIYCKFLKKQKMATFAPMFHARTVICSYWVRIMWFFWIVGTLFLFPLVSKE